MPIAQAFSEYQSQRAKYEREQARLKRIQAREAFLKLLERSSQINDATTYEEAERAVGTVSVQCLLSVGICRT